MPDVGTTHHVRIGTNYYQVMPGSYRKRLAPPFGPRFSTGDPDYSNLTFWQHWVQSCWIGGFGADAWTDDSMFDEGSGVDGSQHEVLLLSRDLSRPSSKDYEVGSTVFRREFVSFNSSLYVCVMGSAGNAKLWMYDEANDEWDLVITFTESVQSVVHYGGYLIFGDGGANLTKMDDSHALTSLAKPSGRTESPRAMMPFRDRLYVAFGRYIWRLKPDLTWDGSTVFHEAVGVSEITAMEHHLGFLYMCSMNGHILRTDGNATFDLWQFDPGVNPLGMRSYDGRMFVSTTESEVSSAAGSGVIYQFTGSAVTELKRWGVVNRYTHTYKMRVYFRKLFFGASNSLGNSSNGIYGFGIATYDAREDAYHIFAQNRDDTTYAAGSNGVNHIVDDVVYWKGYLYATVRGHGIFRVALTFKDATRALATYDTTAAGASAGSKNGGWVESSEFDAGTPGLLKYFRQLVLHVDLPNSACSVYVETSLDGGLNWTNIGTATKTGSATRYRVAFSILAKSTRIKYRLTLRTTNSAYSPQVRAVNISYLPMPDPTWQWEMTLGLVSEPELMDGTTDLTVDPDVEAAYLEGLTRAGLPISFTDIDGTVWSSGGGTIGGVLIQQFEKDVPFRTADTDGPIESFVKVTLIEALTSAIELS